MITNYLRIALRTLRRRPGVCIINVAGLATGLAACVVIALFVHSEWTADAFHERSDEVYRVTYKEVDTPAMRHVPTISPPMGPALVDEYPEIEAFLRLRDSDRHHIRAGDRQVYESQFLYADSTFFDLFTYRFAHGTAKRALDRPGAVVLTRSTARKYFGETNPVGRTMVMDGEQTLEVTGVVEPPAGRTHLDFDFLISFETFDVPRGYPVTLDSWSWISFYTYVRLRPGTDPARLEERFPAFMARHFSADRAERVRLQLQPVEDIYLGTPRDPFFVSGNRTYLVGLSGVAVLLLLIAAFNYTNLSVAESLTRAREAAVRRAMGARTVDLIRQFVGEAVLTAAVACLLAVGVAAVAIPVLESWLGMEFAARRPSIAVLIPGLTLVVIVLGSLTGLYPAWVASRFQPTVVLRGATGTSLPGRHVRTVLVTAQFAIAVAMIAGSLVIARQMAFVRNANLGFETEQVIALHLPGEDVLARYGALEERLRQNQRVMHVTQSSFLPGQLGGSVPIYPEGQQDGDDIRTMRIVGTHYGFFETLGIEVEQGRAFSRGVRGDSSNAVILNRTAAAYFAGSTTGWDEPLGKNVRVGDIVEGRVIGITADTHFGSLHQEIPPVVMYIPPTAMEHVLVRVRPGHAADVVESIQADWASVMGDAPFDYTFLDDHVDQLYRADARFYRAVQLFSGLALLLACLGLYGLGASVIRLRMREVGVRKVLGASVLSLVALLSTSFLRYLALGVLIACPVAYVVVDQWLQTFAFRADIGVMVFIVAGAGTLAAALLAVSRHTVAAARCNPATVLRTE